LRFLYKNWTKEKRKTSERFFSLVRNKKMPRSTLRNEAKLPKIERSVEIQASKDRVWDIVSDLENEGEYWYGTREVKTIFQNGNEIDREITQNFRNHKILQKAILRPKESIEIRYLKGLTEGVKIISIESLEEDRQRVKALWDVHFTGLYRLATPFIKRHTENGTIHALERIKRTAEAMPAQTSKA
jgi:hypothetical protein